MKGLKASGFYGKSVVGCLGEALAPQVFHVYIAFCGFAVLNVMWGTQCSPSTGVFCGCFVLVPVRNSFVSEQTCCTVDMCKIGTQNHNAQWIATPLTLERLDRFREALAIIHPLQIGPCDMWPG